MIFKCSFNCFLEGTSDSDLDDSRSATVLDFSKFRDMQNYNYLYFSAQTGLLEASSLNALKWDDSNSTQENNNTISAINDFSDFISTSNQFVLCVVNPTDEDLKFLATKRHVHELTIRDIKEQNTEEKVEVFKHYTFISFKVYLDGEEKVSGGGV